jgi:hypothetical protein
MSIIVSLEASCGHYTKVLSDRSCPCKIHIDAMTSPTVKVMSGSVLSYMRCGFFVCIWDNRDMTNEYHTSMAKRGRGNFECDELSLLS